MKSILMRLVKDFNEYSELVALNYAQKREGNFDEGILEWNRGHLSQIEDYLKELSQNLGITLTWECKEHTFGYDDWKRQLTYKTVSVSFEEMEKLGA